MSARVNKGMRWFKWVLWILLITFGVKALFAFGQPNSGNKLALAVLGLVGGTILFGGVAFFLGWLTGKVDIPVSPGLNPVSSPAEIPPGVRATTYQSLPNPTSHANVIPSSPMSPVQGKTMISNAEALDEDGIYNSIAHELETGIADKGLWTRLFADCEGDEKQTKVLYIKRRAAKLIVNERLRAAEVTRLQSEETAKRIASEKLQAQHAYTILPKGKCPNCHAVIPLESEACPKCAAIFEKGAAWHVLPLVSRSEIPGIARATNMSDVSAAMPKGKSPGVAALFGSLAVVLLVAGLIFFSGAKSTQPNDEKISPAESASDPTVAAVGKPETVPQIPLPKCKTGWQPVDEFFKDCEKASMPAPDSKAASKDEPKTGELMPWEMKWDYTPPAKTNSTPKAATFTLDQYDFVGARKAGVSDTAILEYLDQQGLLTFNLRAARKDGQSDTAILDSVALARMR